MKRRTRSWSGEVMRAVLLVVIAALVALPAAASDATTTTGKAPVIKASMERIVARDLRATPDRPVVVRSARQGQSAGSSPGFFKTRPGMIALVVMAAGTGYALYSAQHDRIHSAGKK